MNADDESSSNQRSFSIKHLILVLSVICFVEPVSVFFNARYADWAQRRTFVYKHWVSPNNTSQLLPPSIAGPVNASNITEANNNTTKIHFNHSVNTTVFEISQRNHSINSTVLHFNRSNQTKQNDSAKVERTAVELGQRYAYWGGGQERFCDVIRQVTNVTTIGVHTPYHIKHNLTPPLLRVTLNCTDITTSSQFGTGNWIIATYDIRMAAALGMVDLEVKCHGGMARDLNHLISWFVGYFPSPTKFQKWPYGEPIPNQGVACRSYDARIDNMARVIQSDLRMMAVTVLGSRKDRGWTHPLVPLQQPPLVANADFDDVVIHFRCGDVFGGWDRNDYGIIGFSEYKKRISPTATTTLGIVTQPFTKNNFTRATDMKKSGECRQAVTALVNYLRNFLPKTTIRIRNDVNEPLAVTYARMMMSKQVFTSHSTFGIFPVIGTFGDGYFQNSKRKPWSNYLPATLSNVHMMEAPFMGTWEIKKAGLNATLAWLLSPV